MKKVILSADGDSIIYLVPDIVADNLEKYCIEFCDDWLWHSPQAAKYRMGAGLGEELSEEFRELPYFNF